MGIRYCSRSVFVFALQLLVLLPWLVITSVESKTSQTYIIHMDHSQKPDHFSNHESWHQHTVKSLSSACPHDKEKETILYSYTHVMHGFSAKLTSCQLAELEKSPAHVTTCKESFGKMLTTHSPRFLGLNRGAGIWPAASFGKDVIIGMLDTGIWPESESFNDHGMAKVPARWKGECESSTTFNASLCNNKLIGARSFSKGLLAAGINISTESDFDSPRDYFGHGSHTSSTAAGNYVYGASHFGYANGVAKGVAPRAHLAMYKVLFKSDTLESASTDVLAGMDQAIADGVDIMSLSLALEQVPLFEDVIAIASFSAIEKGIVVVCAAGNSGPNSSTIFNGAPWIVTVGAGTLDRSNIATLELGNGMTFEGASNFPTSVLITNTTLYYGSNDRNASGCSVLSPSAVKGKVVLCDESNIDLKSQMNVVSAAGAYGAIFLTESLRLYHSSIPSILLHTLYAKAIKEYAKSGNNTMVKRMRFGITKLGTGPAPQVAYTSSRGPDPISPSVLKPYILAPGVDVLGAVRPDTPHNTVVGSYDLLTDYMFFSGTSMAAPNVAGVVALVKAIHPDWSPAMIRSAMMTTATKTDNTHGTIRDQWTGATATPLEFGAGHVNPNRAMDPGLVYDMGSQDYINFLCGLGYTKKQMSTLLRRTQWSCDNRTDLNYPSFIANFFSQTTSMSEKIFTRTVRNIGHDESTYHATFNLPDGMIVKVEPNTLRFTKKYQEKNFVLSIQVDKQSPKVNYGFLEWIDEHNHIVSSPIVVVKD